VVRRRVSFENSFDSKPSNLEPSFGTIRNKTFDSVVSLLYRNREFQCFEWTETNRRPTKQFDREHILLFFTENVRFFLFFSICFRFFFVFFGFFSLFRNSLFRLFRFYTETESFNWTETKRRPKQFKREYIWEFFRKFRVVSLCFGLLRNRSVCSVV
jgi:hypothetical protein